ncbi:MAG: hypothetical protein ACUVUB_04140 [Candidatus Bathyarchaeia archaeon]
MSKSETSRGAIRERKEKVLASLQNLGDRIYRQIVAGEFPWIKMPSRSINNILYDQKLRQYILGNRSVRRSSRNIRHIRPLTQLVWTAMFVNDLTRQSKTSTLRDVFYSAQAYEMSFTDQQESDNLITDLETVIGYSREDFNVFPEERSAIFGDLTIEYTIPGYEGRRLNLTSHPDGMMIGPALTGAEFIDCKADKVIAIEKGGLFTRFIEERVHIKHKALLVHTAGQAPRATRSFLRRLNQELGLPVYIFTDGDPWGMHIAMVIISGSANAAHLRDLNTPDAKWFGVWASVTGDEPVVISMDGLIRNEPISRIVDPVVMWTGCEAVHFDGGIGMEALCCDSRGQTMMAQITGVLRHNYKKSIYEIVTVGGYRVKTTGNHSVQVFNPETYELQSKPVSELREGELLASCLHIPNVESLTSVNMAELILFGRSNLDDQMCSEGGEALNREAKLRHGAIELSHSRGKRGSLTESPLRLVNLEESIPVTIPITGRFTRLLGYHTARGIFSNSHCEMTFSMEEASMVRDVSDCIRKTFRVKPKIERLHGKVRVRYGGKLLARALSELVAPGGRTSEKRIPYIIFNVQKRFKIDFLRGYLRGSGVTYYKGRKSVAVKTLSRLLAADLIILLRQLGCVAYTHVEDGQYIIELIDTSPIRGLIREFFGMDVGEDPEILSLPIHLLHPLIHQIINHLPYDRQRRIQSRIFREGLYGRISYRELERLLNIIPEGSSPQIDTVRKLVENKVALLPVVQKRQVKMKLPVKVYDIEVSDNHTFVGGLGGMILHNSDIVEYKLPSDKLTELDIKRLHELKKDPRYEGKIWSREIETFMRIKKKAEQEAFSRYGLTYIVDEYLPAKLEMADSY